jgi:DNA-binding CsgD family transcriptional regulator
MRNTTDYFADVNTLLRSTKMDTPIQVYWKNSILKISLDYFKEKVIIFRNMQLDSANETTSSSHDAFIFYRPATAALPEQVFYNEETYSIISNFAEPEGINTATPSYISALCLKWKDIFEENRTGILSSRGQHERKGMWHIAMLESDKRKYLVNAILLTGNSALLEEKQYLFTMERVSSESVNLPMIFRQYKLSNREREIVQLLLMGHGNKEIARDLHLSENTVKGYMKLLMGKLGVNNRAGIIATLLVGKPSAR